MNKKLLFIYLNIFLGILFITTSFAQITQIEPSPTPRPYCFTGWSLQKILDTGGIKAEDCHWKADQYNSRLGQVTFEGKAYPLEYVSVYTTDNCRWSDYVRENVFCPVLNQRVNLSVDKDRISENGTFTVSWSSGGVTEEFPPGTTCTLSGKNPEKGNFSESTRDGSRTYSFVQRGIYPFKFSCNGILDNSKSLSRGTIEKSVTIFAGNIPPAPTVDIKIEPSSIKKGESATLSWSSGNAISLSISQGIGVVSNQGSMKISPVATTRYTITGSGEFPELGLARKSVTLRVAAPEVITEQPPMEAPPETETPAPPKPEEKPKIDLKINGKDGPLTVGSPASLTLSWNLDQYCLAYGSWIGVKNKAGSEQRTLTKPGTYNYRLYCPTIGSDEVTVTISGSGISAIPLPTSEASASTDGKNFSQSIRVTRGETAPLWISGAYDANKDGKASQDETGKWTGLMSNGGRCEYNLDLNQGTPTFEGAIADPKTPEDCTVNIGNLTFFDEPGVYRYGVLRLTQSNGKISNIGYINIAVSEPPPPKGPPVIDLRINNIPGPTLSLGAPAEYDISWSAQNADSCFASEAWGGNKFPSGSQRFFASEKKEFTYALTCVGKLGTTTQSINLKVAELPVCDFSALPLTIDKNSPFNRQSVLSWKCQFANTCSISPTIGNIETFGSVRVSPIETTKYILACQNLEGSSSFDQEIEVR